MRVTVKGQVTIPQAIREKLNIGPYSQVDFVEEKGRVYLVKKESAEVNTDRFSKIRGSATVRMTTEEIMALTRKEKSG
jgi:AbrB family looped-hinge helix DNA binding protein